jgi:hypothetical protein
VRFIADMNLQRADVFSQSISSVSLYVYDENDALAMKRIMAQSQMRSGNSYQMDISDLPAGHYKLIAWAELSDNNSFSFNDATRDPLQIEEMTLRLKKNTRADDGESDENEVIDYALDPLYHGMGEITIYDDELGGDHQVDIHLTNNIKDITVLLQQVNGDEIKASDYTFTVEANNGHINYDNSLIYDDEPLHYTAYSKSQISADLSVLDNTRAGEKSAAVLAYVNTARLVEENDWRTVTRPMLSVTEVSTGNVILKIPLIDYALLVRSKYNASMDTQEYLDRMSEINLTLFLNGNRWINNVVVINSWKVVINDDDFK